MSVQSEITRLENAKAAIKAAIEGKGVTVPDATLLDGMAALIEGIEVGGGSGESDWNENYTGAATLLHVTISDIEKLTISVIFKQSVEYGVTVDWGDGSEQKTYDKTTAVIHNHTYSSVGDYVISLLPSDGCTLSFGTGGSSYNIMASNQWTNRWLFNTLRRVNIGTKGIVSISPYTFLNCASLEKITIPENITSIGRNAFENCYSLREVKLPQSITSLGRECFRGCQELTRIVVPSGVTTLNAYVFYQNYCNTRIILEGSITSIGSNAFAYSYCSYVDLSNNTVVPTLEDTKAFSNYSKILVPSALLEEWVAATNWSYFESQIVGV